MNGKEAFRSRGEWIPRGAIHRAGPANRGYTDVHQPCRVVGNHRAARARGVTLGTEWPADVESAVN